MKKDLGNIIKKGSSILLAGSLMTTMLSGCGKKEALLEDTILEEAIVMYVDDEPIIVRPVSFYDHNDKCNGTHYQEIITGFIYHINNSKYEFVDSEQCIEKGQRLGVIMVDAEFRSLTNYLTEEEIKKANNGTFTDEDVIDIQQRILKESKALK